MRRESEAPTEHGGSAFWLCFRAGQQTSGMQPRLPARFGSTRPDPTRSDPSPAIRVDQALKSRPDGPEVTQNSPKN